MNFKLTSEFKPTGDQPQAIEELLKGIEAGEKFQILQGVTGSGKTFTIANVIDRLNRPVLVLSHNKTLAAQLYGEFKGFFPDNAVEYFVSYYDYYQPEAYLPSSNTYIEKDLTINEEIEKLRLSTTTSLLTGRRDVIVVSSVSCLYGIGNPEDFYANTIDVKKGTKLIRNKFLRDLVSSLYSRNDIEFNRGNFRVTGDTVDVFPAYSDRAVRISFWGDEVDEISIFSPTDGHKENDLDDIKIFPASIFMTTKDRLNEGINHIVLDMGKQMEYFKEIGKPLEAKRIEDRVTYDVEMIKELGYCPGIENYSRYFDGRKSGNRPFCLLDYFPSDFLMIIDESHVTLSQIHAMFGGDRSRKEVLVEYGFRLPAAMDNRPLRFDEFEAFEKQTVYMSATPADYEYQQTGGVVVEQVIRPTGLLDPPITVRPSLNQIDDLIAEINVRAEVNERVLVTTLTKRMAEELADYFDKLSIRCRYIHSDVETVERVQIMEDLRAGVFDVLIGVNLLREGLDLPEVSLVAILDADKEGFLRSHRSLTQTAGRAARHINGKVIMYADKITESMRKTIEQTECRREKQLHYNELNNITPTQITKELNKIKLTGNRKKTDKSTYGYTEKKPSVAADPIIQYMSKEAMEKTIKRTEQLMFKAAEKYDYLDAAKLRDELDELKTLFNTRFIDKI